MDEKEIHVKGMFDRVSKRYDFLNRMMSLGLDSGWKKRTAEKVSSPHSLILDVACGTGDIAIFSRKLGSKVIGLDFSMGMLKIAKKKDSHVFWVRANALQLPFRDGLFDGATSGYAMRNFSDMIKALKEMSRTLKPKGKIAILEFGHPKKRLWNFLYNIHMGFIVPLLGSVFSDKSSYEYLPESIKRFPDQEGVKKIIEEEGFSVSYENLLFGASAIWVGKKN